MITLKELEELKKFCSNHTHEKVRNVDFEEISQYFPSVDEINKTLLKNPE